MKRKEWEDLVCAPTGRADGAVSGPSTWNITKEHAYLRVSTLELYKY